MGWINVTLEDDESTLTENAVESLEASWTDWTAEDGDLELAILEEIAPMAAFAARVAAVVPEAAFVTMGTELWGIFFTEGTPATGELTITAVDNVGYTIPAESEFDIDGVAFMTLSDAVIPAASTSVSNVPVEATEIGTQGNDLLGDLVAPLTPLAFVASAELEAATSGGTDEETIAHYRDRLVRELMLRGITLVTRRDYENLALTQPTISRAVAIQDAANREVEVYVTDADGLTVATGIQAALLVLYNDLRATNWTVTVNDADYTTVDVTASVVAYPGYDTADVDARVTDFLTEWLSPSRWGTPDSGGSEDFLVTSWNDTPVIRSNKLIDLIGDVDGVDYVISVGIESADITGLTGTAATNLLNKTDHGLSVGHRIQLVSKTGGTGISTGVSYFVIASGLAANAFKVSATAGGSEIDFSTDITVATYKVVDDYVGANPQDFLLPGVVPLPQPGSINISVA